MVTTQRLNRLGPYLIVVPAVGLLWLLSAAMFGTLVAAVGAAVIGAGWGLLLGWITTRLSRTESRFLALANGSLFLAILMAGILIGGSIFDLMLLSASARSAPALFTQLQPPVFDAPNLFFIIFNSLLEALLVPAALFLNWPIPRRRKLIIAAALIYYAQRVWTYVYFVPQVYGFTTILAGEGPYPADLAQQVVFWVNLSLIRGIMDALLFVLLLLSAFVPVASDSEGRA